MARRIQGRKRPRRQSTLPWWVFATFGVSAFSLIHLWVAEKLSGTAGNLALIEIQAARYIAWWALGVGMLLAVRAEWRARKRRAWFRQMCDLSAIRRLDWQAFERLVAEAFRRRGFRVELTGQGGADGGVDVVLQKLGERQLVQCKHWRDQSVGAKVVREMFGLMAADGATGVVIVCTGGFTRDARSFAQGLPIELVDGPALVKLMKSVI